MSAIEKLKSYSDPERAEKMRAYHKTDREVLGVTNPQIDAVVKEVKSTPEADLELAQELWDTGIVEARIMTGKLLARPKLTPEMDAKYWQFERDCAADFDGWAIADGIAMAAHKRVLKPDNRYQDLEPWTRSDHLWTKRAALVFTLPFNRLKSPSEPQLQAREEILGWAAEYTKDPEWFIQKSVSWWVRELSRRDPSRARQFLDENGGNMKNFARKDAAKYLDS